MRANNRTLLAALLDTVYSPIDSISYSVDSLASSGAETSSIDLFLNQAKPNSNHGKHDRPLIGVIDSDTFKEYISTFKTVAPSAINRLPGFSTGHETYPANVPSRCEAEQLMMSLQPEGCILGHCPLNGKYLHLGWLSEEEMEWLAPGQLRLWKDSMTAGIESGKPVRSKKCPAPITELRGPSWARKQRVL